MLFGGVCKATGIGEPKTLAILGLFYGLFYGLFTEKDLAGDLSRVENFPIWFLRFVVCLGD